MKNYCFISSMCVGAMTDYKLEATVDVGFGMLEMGQEAPLKGWPVLIYR